MSLHSIVYVGPYIRALKKYPEFKLEKEVMDIQFDMDDALCCEIFKIFKKDEHDKVYIWLPNHVRKQPRSFFIDEDAEENQTEITGKMISDEMWWLQNEFEKEIKTLKEYFDTFLTWGPINYRY